MRCRPESFPSSERRRLACAFVVLAVGLALAWGILACGCARPASAPAGDSSAGAAETDASEAAVAPTAAGTEYGADAEYAAFAEGRLFADALPDEALPKPARALTCFADVVYALDYLAFYRIDEWVWFDVDGAYAQAVYGFYPEYHRAYQAADLADVYACQLEDSYFTQFGVVGIKFSISRDVATQPPASRATAPVIPSFDYALKTGEPFALPIEDSSLEGIVCETGEQLYWLAMHGYRPLPVAGSMAEELYEAAKAVLYSCVSADMSNFAKVKAVYDWLTTQVVYDRETAYSAETYLVREQAYYLEGVFLNRCAVCDGKAKAMVLLLNMLGISCVRDTGAGLAGDHAWNMVQTDGAWYLICSTYGQKDMTQSLGVIVPNYSVFLTGADTGYGEEWDFASQKWPEVRSALAEEPYDIFSAMGQASGVDLRVADLPAAQALAAEIAAKRGSAEPYKVEFLYVGQDREAFRGELVAWLAAQDDVQVTEREDVRGWVYQLLYLPNEEG